MLLVFENKSDVEIPGWAVANILFILKKCFFDLRNPSYLFILHSMYSISRVLKIWFVFDDISVVEILV